MESKFLDKYTAEAHEDADEDFRHGDDEKGKKEDDIIGYIHDLEAKHDITHAKLDELLKRTEHMSDDKREEELKDAEKEADKDEE